MVKRRPSRPCSRPHSLSRILPAFCALSHGNGNENLCVPVAGQMRRVRVIKTPVPTAANGSSWSTLFPLFP